jgi:hypothetical protein
MPDNPRTIPILREKALRLLTIIQDRVPRRVHRVAAGPATGGRAVHGVGPLVDEVIALWLETVRQQTKPRAPSRGPRDERSTPVQRRVRDIYFQDKTRPVAEITIAAGLRPQSQGRVSAYCKELELGHRPQRR